MSEYFDATREVYNLSDLQKEYFDKYQKALTSTLEMIGTSANINEMISNFDFMKDRLTGFDAKVDLNRPVSEQSTVAKLSEITGLKFIPYFRNKCEFVVDAAAKINSDVIKSKKRFKKTI